MEHFIEPNDDDYPRRRVSDTSRVDRWLARAGVVVAGGLTIFAVLSALPQDARPHDAPSGWTYPSTCCSSFDCRQVPEDWVEEQSNGYRIVITGEVIAAGSSKIRNSPDGKVHWCSTAGKADGATICLFMPPRSF